jgi:deazaflavin-dependent oxidoreductase (nitroreductase family)
MKGTESLRRQEFCYLTTTGRVTGKPREIEIWFGVYRRTLYMLSGGRDQSNWVRNIMKNPAVTVRIAGRKFRGAARIVTGREEDHLARRLLLAKYATPTDDLKEWGENALPVAVDLEALAETPTQRGRKRARGSVA